MTQFRKFVRVQQTTNTTQHTSMMKFTSPISNIYILPELLWLMSPSMSLVILVSICLTWVKVRTYILDGNTQ